MEESRAVPRDIEGEIISQRNTSTRWDGERMVRSRFVTRIFKRRLLRLKLGDFTNIESGFALEYFHMTAEKVITYVFMVDTTGGAMRLL